MIGEDFIYGLHSLSDFDMIMCSPEEEQQFVTRTVDRAEITSLRARPNHYTAIYDDTLILNFYIIRDSLCLPQDQMIISGDMIHELRKWLESPKRPLELTITGDSNSITAHYFGLFTSVQPYVIDDKCYGLSLTFTCDSPYGYSDEISRTFVFESGSTTAEGVYENISAESYEYLKPKIVVLSTDVFGESETLEIKNESDGDNTMSITLPPGLSKLIIDCDKKIITDEDGVLVPLSDIGIDTPISNYYSFITADAYFFYWLSLVPGGNSIIIEASNPSDIDEIIISARHIIKSGGF